MTVNLSQPIVIIGTGLAGFSLAKELRKIDKTRALVLITQDDGHFYSKPQLSTALSQDKTPQNLIVTPATEMQTQLNATIYTFSTVEAIDTLAKTLTLQTLNGQQTLSYGQLVLANGALPKQHPMLYQKSHCYQINNLLDYHHFIASSINWQNLLILGSGLVGCEFAYDFTKSPLNIHIVTPDPYPLYKLVPAPIGYALQKSLTNAGITWHIETNLSEIKPDHNGLDVSLTNGTTLKTQALLSAIGLNPNIQLAQKANIKVNQGILVNDFLETSVPDIFALGDCTEINGVCRQYVAPILQSARALAQTLLNQPTPVTFPPTPISLKVAAYPILTFVPPKACEGNWHCEILTEDEGIKGLFYDKNGLLQGYCLGGSAISYRQICLKSLGTSAFAKATA